jgi:hypothetical protein
VSRSVSPARQKNKPEVIRRHLSTVPPDLRFRCLIV